MFRAQFFGDLVDTRGSHPPCNDHIADEKRSDAGFLWSRQSACSGGGHGLVYEWELNYRGSMHSVGNEYMARPLQVIDKGV